MRLAETSPRRLPRYYALGLIYIITYVIIILLIHNKLHFLVNLNDFWGNLWLARVWDWGRPASYFNGFHPVGYTLFLRYVVGVDFDSPAPSLRLASIANALFAGVGLLAGLHLARRRLGGGVWGLAAVVAVSLGSYFDLALLQTSDIGGTAFATLGVALIYKSVSCRSGVGAAAGAGMAIGLAALWRYYGLALALGVAVGLLYVAAGDRRGWLRTGAFVAGFLAVYSAQVAANQLSGHGPFETDTAFNVQVYHFGIDWYHVPEPGTLSLSGVVGQGTRKFFMSYLSRFCEYGLLPLALLTVNLSLARRDLRYIAVMNLATTVMAAIHALGGNARGLVVLLPTLGIEAIVLVRWLLARARYQMRAEPAAGRLIALMIGFALLIVMVASVGARVSDFKARYRTCLNIEHIEDALKADRVENRREVFTSDLDFYLPHHGLPLHNGNWERYDAYGYNPAHPQLDAGSLASFLRDCRRLKVTHLVLNRNASRLGEATGRIYRRDDPEAVRSFALIGTWDDTKVFRVLNDTSAGNTPR